ncbi:MAG: TlpA disulfide reductase family protein [Acidobacteriota bacterium]
MTRISSWTVVLALTAGAAITVQAQSPSQGAAPAPAVAAPQSVITDVRAAIAKNDFAGGEQILTAYRKSKGTTPEALEALSWLGRGALAAKELDQAQAYAEQTFDLCEVALKTRKMDDEPRLPIAIGAAIEVRANVLAERGARADAVSLLNEALAEFKTTSIRTRIQKNINLLSLEGKAAPALEAAEYLGAKPTTLAALKGKPFVVFFWAHWCPDCKAMGPVLAKMLATYGSKGLTVVAPTQRYGYVAARKAAPAAEEMTYIAQIRDQNYPWLKRLSVPVSEESFKRYGASTSPTVVVVDRAGIVRLYHPGQMTQEQIEPLIRAVVDDKPGTAAAGGGRR